MFQLNMMSASISAIIGSPLAGIVIKSAFVIAVAALACKLLHRQSAAVRHRIWVFGLAASLVVPAVYLLFPQFTLDLLPNTVGEIEVASERIDTTPPSSATADSTSSDATGSRARSFIPQPEDIAQTSTALPADQSPTVQSAREPQPRFAGFPGIEPMLVLCWLAGTTTGSILFLIAFFVQSARLRRLTRIDDKDWKNSVDAAADAVGIKRPIVTLEWDKASVPAVVGVLRPRLIVPHDWRTWSPVQRHCILLHELAHVKRRDVLTQLLGRCALLAYWFNPLIWLAVRQLRVERELASDDCVLRTGQTPSDYAEQLLQTLQSCRPVRSAMGVAMAHSARLDQRVLAILDPQRRRDPVGLRFAIFVPCVFALLCGLLGGFTLSTRVAIADSPPTTEEDNREKNADPAENTKTIWMENYTIEYPGKLPVSVAFSADGKILLTGDTSGEVMALVLTRDDARWRWKSNVGGSHAVVAFSADQQKIYVTTKDGVRILDDRGNAEHLIEEKDANPTAIGVFPDKTIAENFIQTQIVFGTPRGYFVKSWAQGKLPDTVGTIQTSTVKEGATPSDPSAVPLAVDPKGRSAIMTGPVDATGALGGVKGENVLWAYVCGDYGDGSPGNRVMVGHTATVVSAAWSKQGDTAVTGDSAGRVIIWDAKTMKENDRLELGDRVAALAISNDGKRVAAYVLGKQGKVFVWETANPNAGMKPIHTELADFQGTEIFASLAFSPDGKRLAGCAMNRKWLTRLGELVGKVRVWELSAEPRAQLPPKHLYSKKLPNGSSSHFVILNNHSILMPANKEGAVDFRSTADGQIQTRLILGKFTIGGMKLSSDRRWLAIQQHAPTPPPNILLPPSLEFDVAIWDMNTMTPRATISSCRKLLDIAPGGKVVAVVRDEQIELWDTATSKRLKSAPFKHTRIDAAAFSPDGKLLAISDQNDLVLWRWEEGVHERIQLGSSVGSLTFSPNGNFLAEGPTPRENIQIRDVRTKKVVKTLTNGTKESMNVPRMAYSHGGRVLIACDNITFIEEIPVPHRINLWDTADGSLAHQLTVPGGLPSHLDVSPNGRHLVVMLESQDGYSLNVWRLDGVNPTKQPGPTPPAAESTP